MGEWATRGGGRRDAGRRSELANGRRAKGRPEELHVLTAGHSPSPPVAPPGVSESPRPSSPRHRVSPSPLRTSSSHFLQNCLELAGDSGPVELACLGSRGTLQTRTITVFTQQLEDTGRKPVSTVLDQNVAAVVHIEPFRANGCRNDRPAHRHRFVNLESRAATYPQR